MLLGSVTPAAHEEARAVAACRLVAMGTEGFLDFLRCRAGHAAGWNDSMARLRCELVSHVSKVPNPPKP